MEGSTRSPKLTGLQKAAILLVALGPEVSAQVLGHCGEAEVERLTLEVFNLRKVAEETKQEVLEECHEMAVARRVLTSGGSE
jgi:flagellar motor switch protein FliG